MGQAAGIGAALAVDGGQKPSEVSVPRVREILLGQNAILSMDDK